MFSPPEEAQQSFIDCTIQLAKRCINILNIYTNQVIKNPLPNVITLNKDRIEDMIINLENYIGYADFRYNKNDEPHENEIVLWKNVFDKYISDICDNNFDFFFNDEVIVRRDITLSANSSDYDIDLTLIYMAVTHPRIATCNDNKIKELRGIYIVELLDVLMRAYPKKMSLDGVYSHYDYPRSVESMASSHNDVLDDGMDLMGSIIGELAPDTKLNKEGIEQFKTQISNVVKSNSDGRPTSLKDLTSGLRSVINPDLFKGMIKQ